MTPQQIKIALLAGGWFISCLGSGWIGYKISDAEYQRHLSKEAKAVTVAVKKVAKVETQQSDVAREESDNRQARDAKTEVVYRTITNTIREYMPDAAPRPDCPAPVPVGFALVFDSAFRGDDPSKIPAAANADVLADTGISLLTVADTTALNAKLCRVDRSEVLAWRAWYDRNDKIWRTMYPEAYK